MHRRSGKASLALIPDSTGIHKVVDIEKRFQLSDSELKRLAFDVGMTPRVGRKDVEYAWLMFFPNYPGHKNSLITSISKLVNRDFTPKLLHTVASDLSKIAPSPLTTITSAADFLIYEHWVHEFLQNWWQGIVQNHTANDTMENFAVALCSNSVQNDIAKHVADFFRKRIDDTLKDNSTYQAVTFLESEVESIVSSIVNPIIEDKSLVTNITSFVETKVHSRIQRELNRGRLFEDTKRIAGLIYRKSETKSRPEDLIDDGALTKALIKSLTGFKTHLAATDTLLKTSGLPSLKNLLGNYSVQNEWGSI